MKLALVLAAVLGSSVLFQAQDLTLREEAERIVERADAASTSPNLPNLERVDTFRAFGDGAPQEGTVTRVVIQGVGRRDEYKLGDYDLINVWTQKQVAVKGTQGILPPDLDTVARNTPINLVRFDDQDVIRTIGDRQVSGHSARCIQFDTIHGAKTDSNEICVDTTNGMFLQEKLGQEFIEYGDYFPFAGALMPGSIRYSFAGAAKLEITQMMTALSASDANVLAAPPNASMHGICTTFRRPFGVSMPQPKAGNGGSTTDIVIRGTVGFDGKVYGAVVQSSERPDLNQEALTLANQWRFTPAMCNGRPDAHEVDFTLEFQGR
jgi:TonB family protein